MPVSGEFMTLREAAEELGLAQASVRDAVRRGSLTVVKLNATMSVVQREEVERYRRENLSRPHNRGRRGQPGARGQG